jgi:WD40 repeat protein
VVREIDPSDSPQYQLKVKYELPPRPKFSDSGVSFSPDGKFFAFDAGKTLQIHENRTGEKRFELPNDRPPDHWLNDSKILIYNYGGSIEAVEVATGRQLYKQKMIEETVEFFSNSDQSIPETIVVDSTKIVPHPDGRMFLAYSNQYVRICDSQTGEFLQTLVEPPLDTSKPPHPKKGPRLSDKKLVWKADWSPDGKTLYIISAERKSVSLWQLIEN